MNKAFCKEPEQSGRPLCPRCGAEGIPVPAATLRARLDPVDAESLGEPAAWCDTETCPVGYFDDVERVVEAARVRGVHWPKNPAGALCACHGLTIDDVDADIAEGEPTRVRKVLLAAASGEAQCALLSADGRSCVARVQRAFVRRKGAGG